VNDEFEKSPQVQAELLVWELRGLVTQAWKARDVIRANGALCDDLEACAEVLTRLAIAKKEAA
jgi:hypothetical protein